MAFINITKKKVIIGGVFLFLILFSFLLVRNLTDLTGNAVFDIEENLDNSFQDDGKNMAVTSNVDELLAIDKEEIKSENTNVPKLGGEIYYTTPRRRGGGSSPVDVPSSNQEVEWEEMYSYSDEYSEGEFFINSNDNYIEVSRSYVWKAEFGTVFNGKIQVVSSNDAYSWYGSRLALVDPENPLIRYEIRLLPSEDKLEVRYVDRTNRTGMLSGIDINTISEQLIATDCNIEIGTWYVINIIKDDNFWKAQLFSLTNPTCFVEWEDDRIIREKFAIGIQSAGKYVVSKFDTLIAL